MACHYCKLYIPYKYILLTDKTGAIDDAHRTVSNVAEEPKRAEGKQIVAELAKLKYELQHDRKLTYEPLSPAAIFVNNSGPFPMMVNLILRPTTKNWNN
jgi:hypothetical protein